ncbi:hypothetical protein FOZ62_011404, partial [Perkinsus olseni]
VTADHPKGCRGGPGPAVRGDRIEESAGIQFESEGLEVRANAMDKEPWVTAKSFYMEFAAGDHKFRWSLQQRSERTVFNESSQGASTGWYSFSGYADSRGMSLHASSASTVRDND